MSKPCIKGLLSDIQLSCMNLATYCHTEAEMQALQKIEDDAHELRKELEKNYNIALCHAEREIDGGRSLT